MEQDGDRTPDFIVITALCSRPPFDVGVTASLSSSSSEHERQWALSYQPAQWQDLRHDELPSPNHIRLLQKHEKEDHRLFTYTLGTFHIDEAPHYTALSYTWGPSYVTADHIDTGDDVEYDYHVIVNGQIHHVSQNLFLALRRMSTPDESWIWADQICIDQADDEEKAIQVARMGTIYAKAAGTYVWLREQDKAAEMVFEIVETFVPAWLQACDEGKLSVSQAVTLGEEDDFWKVLGVVPLEDREVNSIIRFFNRSWFERAWTIQEVALGKEVAVACGGLALNWLFFSTFSWFLWRSGLYLAMQNAKNLSLAPQTVISFEANSRIYGVKQTIDTQAVGGIPMTYGKLRDIYIEQYSRGLRSCPDTHVNARKKGEFYTVLAGLVAFFRGAKAARPVDKIFAPLAVATQLLACEECRHHYLTPDYSSPTADIFLSVTRTIIEQTKSLSILSQIESRATPAMHDLPSWVPDFSNRITSSMILANSGKTLLPTPRFDAMAGSSEPFRVTVAGKKLMVRGAIWQTVVETIPDRPDAAFNLRPLLYLKLATSLPNLYANDQKRAEVLWRTMICDHKGDVHPAPDLSREFYDYVLARTLGSFDAQDEEEILAKRSEESLDWPGLDALSNDAEGTIPSVEDVMQAASQRGNGEHNSIDHKKDLERSESFSRLHRVARSQRRMFRTSRGALGHGASDVQDGDVIAFLVGATVPFILRSLGDDCYRVIGETYIHGYMHGEVLQGSVMTFQDIVLC